MQAVQLSDKMDERLRAGSVRRQTSTCREGIRIAGKLSVGDTTGVFDCAGEQG